MAWGSPGFPSPEGPAGYLWEFILSANLGEFTGIEEVFLDFPFLLPETQTISLSLRPCLFPVLGPGVSSLASPASWELTLRKGEGVFTNKQTASATGCVQTNLEGAVGPGASARAAFHRGRPAARARQFTLQFCSRDVSGLPSAQSRRPWRITPRGGWSPGHFSFLNPSTQTLACRSTSLIRAPGKNRVRGHRR